MSVRDSHRTNYAVGRSPSAVSQMGDRFSTAIEAMSTRITQLEGLESLPPTSSHPTTPQRGDEGESDRPQSVGRSFYVGDIPIMGWEPIDDKL